LAEGLSVVAARLGPKEAGQAATSLIQAMGKTTNVIALQAFAEALSAVVAPLGPVEATAVCGQAAASLTQAMGNETNPYSLPRLAQGLSAVLCAMDTSSQSLRALHVAAAVGISANGREPLSPLPLLYPACDPLHCRLSTPQLVDLLKNPLCVGEARRCVLIALAVRYKRKFADQWEFVRFAEKQKLGLDFTSPPRRLTAPAPSPK
jgi:hypothetical protein